MPWTNRPFDYFGTSPTQILDDLTKANDNFEILGQAFVGNDPTTQKAKDADKVDGYHASQTPSANTIPVADVTGIIANAWLSNAIRGFENPIDTVAYYNQTGREYFLQVGEVAKISFSNTTIVPLRIATQSGTLYYLCVSTDYYSLSGNGAFFLAPNNIIHSGQFKFAIIERNSVGLYHDFLTLGDFEIGRTKGMCFCLIVNFLTAKQVISISTCYDEHSPVISAIRSVVWDNVTTPWTSLGTIVFRASVSGYVLVQRIL